MGSWSEDSCCCDSVFDYIEAKNIWEMTQREANTTIRNSWEDIELNRWSEEVDKLGIVTWILSQGLKVSKNRLKEVLEIAKEHSIDKKIKEYGWVNPKKRKETLLQEIKEIRRAMKNDGRGRKKQMKGRIYDGT